MSFWGKLFGRRAAKWPYGLHPDTPVLCGGGVSTELDYLERLRCPAGMPVRFERQGSLERTAIEYVERPDVALHVSHGSRRRLGELDLCELPLDAYLIVCECGQHHEQVFIDMYFRGPEMPIGVDGWTLVEGVSPADTLDETAPCPYCGKELRTPAAKQCRSCLMDWHDPNNVYRRERKAN